MTKWRQEIETTWGKITAIWNEKGLWALYLPCDKIAEDAAQTATDTEIMNRWENKAESLAAGLKAYFSGGKVKWDIPLDMTGYTNFQTAVLLATGEIGYGEVLTYKDVARSAGNEKAARAAGGALHINRLPIIIPCHRVIGSNGSMVGFAGGIEMKKNLLALEKRGVS